MIPPYMIQVVWESGADNLSKNICPTLPGQVMEEDSCRSEFIKLPG